MRWVVAGLLLMALGGVIIVLPDANDRLFSLSEEHGPAPIDALGFVVLLVGYLLLVGIVWRRRRRLSRVIVAPALAVVLAGTALLVPAVVYDLGALWAVAAAVMVLPQVYLLVQALRRARAVPR